MTIKLWTKPSIDVTDVRLAKFHMYAEQDNGGALKTLKNQS